VMILAIDGRPHLEQAKPVFAAGKPLYIDKPMAGSLADAIRIFRLAEEHNASCFTSSSLRFAAATLGMKTNPQIGEIRGCDQYSPCSLEPHHPDFFWYGIHGVEPLFTVMGTGCQTVTRIHTEGQDMAVGVWEGGRIGSTRGIRDSRRGYGSTVFGTKAILPAGGFDGYEPLIVEIVKFFKTGKPPVAEAETLEIIAFMEAADESKRRGGKEVTIAETLAATAKPAVPDKPAATDQPAAAQPEVTKPAPAPTPTPAAPTPPAAQAAAPHPDKPAPEATPPAESGPGAAEVPDAGKPAGDAE